MTINPAAEVRLHTGETVSRIVVATTSLGVKQLVERGTMPALMALIGLVEMVHQTPVGSEIPRAQLLQRLGSGGVDELRGAGLIPRDSQAVHRSTVGALRATTAVTDTGIQTQHAVTGAAISEITA